MPLPMPISRQMLITDHSNRPGVLLVLLSALAAQRQLSASPFPSVSSGGRDLVEAARRRLRLWDISEADVAGPFTEIPEDMMEKAKLPRLSLFYMR